MMSVLNHIITLFVSILNRHVRSMAVARPYLGKRDWHRIDTIILRRHFLSLRLLVAISNDPQTQ